MVKENKTTNSKLKRYDMLTMAVLVAIIILVNYVGFSFFHRFDLTTEKRYTLAESTRGLLKNLDDEVLVKVYLNGDVNPGFNRLKNETREILDQFRAYSNNQIQYEFITLGEGTTKTETEEIEKQLYKDGLVPEGVTTKTKDKTTELTIWPGAIITYKKKSAVWQIFNRQSPGIDPETCINNSVEELEYSLTNTLRKLQRVKRPEVTFLQGHRELDTVTQYYFMKTLSEYYNVNRTSITKGRELTSLKGSDALIISKPDTSFTDKEKFIIDQYIMNGGKVLWLIDALSTNVDSLYRGYTYGLNRPLEVEEMLFKYGVRLNQEMALDMNCGVVTINIGFQKGQAKYQAFPWPYFPLVLPVSDHPIVKNLDLIKFEYAGTLDTTTARGIKKTILLQTSRYTKTMLPTVNIYLSSVQNRLNETQFKNPYRPLAVLLEGNFHSFVENRLPSALLNDTNFKYKDIGVPNKMIVVSDGDVARNDYNRITREVLPLGFDRSSGQTFANKTFLLNCINYLLDDEGMLQLRARDVKLRLLDKKKVNLHRAKWQFINVAVPLLAVILFACLQFYVRKRKYGKRATKS